MMVTALDDLHMIKFKQGWFTLVKYDYEVFEKKNTALRQELEEHAKAQKIEKPSTWISESTLIKFENKFKDMPWTSEKVNTEELKQTSENKSAAKPKSQSKVAMKRARAAEMRKNAGGLPNIGLNLNKKVKLRLDTKAIGDDGEMP
jgi:hypothetical protein